MEAVLLPKSWNVDQILDDLDQHGFAIIDDAYSNDYVHQLIEECTSNLNRFREAAIQNGVISKIRSDHILWLNPELVISNHHVQALYSLGQELNRAFISVFETSKHILLAITLASFMPYTVITLKAKMAA
jgi:SM-20-related protein